MDHDKFTTSQVDATLGVNACNAYAAGDYKNAQKYLQEILDMEPNNWLARFYLATCYAKTDQLYAAQRAFRYIYEKSTDPELKSKAVMMLQRVTGHIEEGGGASKPLEFGRFLDAPGVPGSNKSAWNNFDR